MNDDTPGLLDQLAPEPAPEAAGLVLTAAGPQPLLAGTFAVYSDDRGGFVLVADTVDGEGTSTVHRKAIPAAMVKLVTGGGPLGGMFRRMAG